MVGIWLQMVAFGIFNLHLNYFRYAILAQGLCQNGTRFIVRRLIFAPTLCQNGITSELFSRSALCHFGTHIYM